MAVDINELQRRLHERILSLAAREAEDLKAALGAVDDISLPLLRFHLLAEQMLERIISGVLKRPDRILDEGRLTFAQKLSLVHAFDVVDDAAISALRRVNACGMNALTSRASRSQRVTLTASDSHLVRITKILSARTVAISNSC